ncbi:hypothetical protein [Stenotrophomonas rhizophila]
MQRDHIDLGKRTVERDLESLLGRFDLHADKAERPFLWSWRKEANFHYKPTLTDSQGFALLLVQAHLRSLLTPRVPRGLQRWFQMAHRELLSGAWRDGHQRTVMIPAAMLLKAPVLDDDVLHEVNNALGK